MLKRSYVLILIAFLFTGCSHHKQKPQPLPTAALNMIAQARPVSAFSQVNVKGIINVTLHTGYRRPSVVLRGDSRDLAQVKTFMNGSALYIVAGKGTPKFGAISADVKSQTLTRINYVGAGRVSGPRLYTKHLDVLLDNAGTTRLDGSIGLKTLTINDGGLTQIGGIKSHDLQIFLKKNPKVQLRGYMDLRTLAINGGGALDMYWVKSDYLKIRAKGSANIQMAGYIDKLDAELWGLSKFKARHLRINRAFVKTHGRSVAEISAVNHQHCLATDASDIYYYTAPKMKANFMAYNGSVLDMREWNEFEGK